MSDVEKINKLFDDKIKELEDILPKKYLTQGDMLAYNCAALTMKHFLEIINVHDVNLINMASPTASVARTCGAVNASLMIIGIITGQKGNKLLHQKQAAAEAMKYITRFKKEFGTVNCQELTGCDLLTMQGMQDYLRQEIWSKQCYKQVIVSLDLIRKLYSKEIARLLE